MHLLGGVAGLACPLAHAQDGQMIAVGVVLLWSAYGVASYGYVLVRGWDIPARQWFSPLSPYQWPKSGDPPPIPQDQILPGQPGTGASEGGGGKIQPGKPPPPPPPPGQFT